ncbi:metal transporter [Paraferrimonas sp. SM1919]|uniref:metal transporter n=1 Tax=Paraferrimonas sp. SM1919 TaxID=2662263 RepID=UPI0013D4771F|nr:metal transporter [Paraferrimonas sp. SM1919]
MLLLLISSFALLLGPICYQFLAHRQGLLKAIDGFIFVTLGGMVLTHLLPELIHHGGLAAIFMVLVGLFGPTLSERIFKRFSRTTHNITLFLGVFGLMLHTLTDGSGLSLSNHGGSLFLALGIIIHRLPVGLTIWWLIRPQFGVAWGSITIAMMILFTAIGFTASEHFWHQLSLDNTVLLQAFVTGTILHVVLHQPHAHEHSHHHSHQHQDDHKHKDAKPQHEYQAGVGSLIGLGFLGLLFLMPEQGHDLQHHHQHRSGEQQLIAWAAQLAPWILACYVLASVQFKLQLQQTKGPVWQWLQRLTGPEAILLVLCLLGPWWALIQLGCALAISLLLSKLNVTMLPSARPMPTNMIDFSLHFQVLRSAPWIIISLLTVNLIGHPELPIDAPALQVLLVLAMILPMRFCHIGATVLAISLAWSGWHPQAVLLPLIAGPLLNLKQLGTMNGQQGATLMALTLVLTLGGIPLPALEHNHQHHIESWQWAALGGLLVLFGHNLLRTGPRKFLSNLMAIKIKNPHSH